MTLTSPREQMASQAPFADEDFSCPVCQEIFKLPVILLCNHSFCSACIKEWWKHKKTNECPLCKKINKRKYLHSNLVLKNLCESIISDKHWKINPKEKSKELLKFVQNKLDMFIKAKTISEQTAEHIKVQTQKTERKIKEQFNRLHQFLQEEEEARIDALREEEEKKTKMVKEKIDDFNTAISTISNSIRFIEEELRANNTEFYKTTVRFQQQDPKPASGALIDEAKYLGNLTFRVWDKMKDIVSYTPVILDPNTAHPACILSDDLTSVRGGQRQQLPDNPERFNRVYCVVGSQGFNSGTHCWDVEVGDNENWDVGVLEECLVRKGRNGGPFWKINLEDGKYKASSVTGTPVDLPLKQSPKRIRVQVDWNGGKLSFSDPDANRALATFAYTFTDTLFPFVQNGDDTLPLKMLQREISVSEVDDHTGVSEVSDHTGVSARLTSGRPAWLQAFWPRNQGPRTPAV